MVRYSNCCSLAAPVACPVVRVAWSPLPLPQSLARVAGWILAGAGLSDDLFGPFSAATEDV